MIANASNAYGAGAGRHANGSVGNVFQKALSASCANAGSMAFGLLTSSLAKSSFGKPFMTPDGGSGMKVRGSSVAGSARSINREKGGVLAFGKGESQIDGNLKINAS